MSGLPLIYEVLAAYILRRPREWSLIPPDLATRNPFHVGVSSSGDENTSEQLKSKHIGAEAHGYLRDIQGVVGPTRCDQINCMWWNGRLASI